MPKRKRETDAKQVGSNTPGPSHKKQHLNSEAKASSGAEPTRRNSSKRQRINKLTPARPWPTVPTSVSATGPRSAHAEGKNYICVSRKTPLGAYMRRCKDVFIKDGYKTLHLSAMGAAIPHLAQLAAALPPILPFPRDEVHTELTTGTAEVMDEVVPDDEEEDITMRTRGKSTLRIVIKIGDGDGDAEERRPSLRTRAAKRTGGQERFSRAGKGSAQANGSGGSGGGGSSDKHVVFQEPDQDE